MKIINRKTVKILEVKKIVGVKKVSKKKELACVKTSSISFMLRVLSSQKGNFKMR